MNLSLQKNIFIGFFRAGILGYGGGPSSIPLVHREVVGTYKWMTDAEFGDVLAIGNTLPGPISTKMAGYIGYRVGGITGLVNAIMATVIPSVVMMIILIGFLAFFRDSPIIAGMTQAIAPIIGIMLASLAYSFLKEAKSGLGWAITIVLCAVSFILFQFVNVHPGLMIGSLLLYGLVCGGKKAKVDSKKRQKPSQTM